jgi:hypothetical protein
LIDYDNDGWLNIFRHGLAREAEGRGGASLSCCLFHNNYDGTFTALTAKAGVSNERSGLGAYFDHDGWSDIRWCDLERI